MRSPWRIITAPCSGDIVSSCLRLRPAHSALCCRRQSPAPDRARGTRLRLTRHAAREKSRWRWIRNDLAATRYEGTGPRRSVSKNGVETTAYLALSHYVAYRMPLAKLRHRRHAGRGQRAPRQWLGPPNRAGAGADARRQLSCSRARPATAPSPKKSLDILRRSGSPNRNGMTRSGRRKLPPCSISAFARRNRLYTFH